MKFLSRRNPIGAPARKSHRARPTVEALEGRALLANFISFGGSYYAATDSRLTWQQAESQAQSLGGHLASVTSQAEQRFLTTNFAAREDIWIGLSSPGAPSWTTGEPVSYTAFFPGEPNNLGGIESVVHMNLGSGLWNDNTVIAKYRGIIEINSATIDINNTPLEDDDITLFNQVPLVQAYAQTIPVTITNTGMAQGRFALSVDPPSAGTLSKPSVDLAAGRFEEVVFTPKANSSAVNGVKIVALSDGQQVSMSDRQQVGMEDMTIVSVTIPNRIRSVTTPPTMVADRIPPRVKTQINVTVTPDLSGSGQVVALAVTGQSVGNGIVTLNGNLLTPLIITKTGPVDLSSPSGITQTAPGGHQGNLQLAVLVRGQDTVRSNGFSVAAIPVGVDVSFLRLVGSSPRELRRGIQVRNVVKSDSGNPNDLDAISISEEVQSTPGTGSFAGGRLEASGYRSVAYTMSNPDTHDVLASLIRIVGSTRDFHQTFKFVDTRTGAQDIPVANSGFIITQTVILDSSDGKVKLKTTKRGAATTARGIASNGGATFDFAVAGPIIREQLP